MNGNPILPVAWAKKYWCQSDFSFAQYLIHYQILSLQSIFRICSILITFSIKTQLQATITHLDNYNNLRFAPSDSVLSFLVLLNTIVRVSPDNETSFHFIHCPPGASQLGIIYEVLYIPCLYPFPPSSPF